jgi:hypothetical protein
MVRRFFLADEREFDTQPEKDVSRSRMLSLSMGLLLGCGLILGGLLGALTDHFLVDGVFGIGSDNDIWIGAVAGAIIVAIIAVGSVRKLSARAAAHDQSHAPVTH